MLTSSFHPLHNAHTLTYLQLIALPSIRTVYVLRTVTTAPLCPYLSIVCMCVCSRRNEPYCTPHSGTLFECKIRQAHLHIAIHRRTCYLCSSTSALFSVLMHLLLHFHFLHIERTSVRITSCSLALSQMTLDPFRKCHNTRINLCTKFGCKSFGEE